MNTRMMISRTALVLTGCLVCLMLAPAGVWAAAEREVVSVTVGAMEVVETPFPVQGFRVADPNLAKVETLDERRLRVMGLKPGTTDLQVTGEGGVSALYSITVIENIKAVLAAVKRDLDSVPELDLSINLGRVTVKGEVSSIDHWELLQKVLNVYKGQMVNLATFRPAPEVMLILKNSLEKSGLKVLQDQEPSEPGVVGLKFSGNNIFITGQVYSPKDVEHVMSVVQSQNWLALKKDEQQKDAARIMAVVNLSVVPTLIELDAVFVGVTDQEYKQIGVNLAKAGLLAIDTTAAAFKGTIGRDRASGWAGSYAINSGLQGALKFFTGSGPGRFRTAGHMTFKNDSPDWKSYHSGGTLKVRISNQNTTGLQDIDYGLIMKVKGGLLNATNATMDLDLELSYPVPLGTDYDLKRNRINTAVNCPLGQTLVLSGMKSLLEQSSNEGVPFLRSVPIIQWFFAEDNTLLQNSQVLILMSPQLVGAPRPAAPVSEETVSTEDKAKKSSKEREKAKRGRRFFFF